MTSVSETGSHTAARKVESVRAAGGSKALWLEVMRALSSSFGGIHSVVTSAMRCGT